MENQCGILCIHFVEDHINMCHCIAIVYDFLFSTLILAVAISVINIWYYARSHLQLTLK